MFSWLKDKTFGKLQYWFSERIARAYQKSHTRRLQEMAKNLPKELVEINKVLAILNNNSLAVHHLFKKAKNKNEYANAFLYFFFSFELNLKHLIISEMNSKNAEAMLSNIKNSPSFFLVYSEEEILKILDLGPVGKVIKKFLEIRPSYNAKDDLWKINDERNNIIHDMLKKEMNETDIEQSFQNFFKKIYSEINNVFKEFYSILAERPTKFLEKLQSLEKNSKE